MSGCFAPRRESGTALLPLLLALACAYVLLSAPSLGHTQPELEQRFSRAAASLNEGAYSEAIAELEQLSDLGVHHPDASHNRALAYLLRAESPKKRPGDLGQAAAALREVLANRDDADAAHALDATRREISRLRAQRGLDPVVVAPPLGRAVVELAPESVWAALTLLASFVTGLGLVLRRAAHHTPRRLAGQICTASGGGLLLCFGLLTAWASHNRATTHEAVIVVDEAPLLDEHGKRLSAKALDVEASAIPEGASVWVHGQAGQLVRVTWGSFEAWVQASHVRILHGASQ